MKSNVYLRNLSAAVTVCVLTAVGWAIPVIGLSASAGPPTTYVAVSGSGFPAGSLIKIYFDTSNLASVVSSSTGSFSKVRLQIPREALPGTHWVEAIAAASGVEAEKAFLVRTNWVEFGFTPSNTRYNPYENLLSPSTVGGLALHWSFKTGSLVYSSPAIADGVLYVGSVDGYLYALNASTGAKLWSFRTGTISTSSPAVANGVVYVGSADWYVYALNASTGAKLWSFYTAEIVDPSPAVVNGVVYVASGNGYVYALSANTGARLWSFASGDRIVSSPALANGVVYIGSQNGYLYALNANTGTELWSFATGDWVFSSPTVANGVVYIASVDHSLYALEASTGAKLWSFATGAQIVSSPAVANGVVYIGSLDGNLYAVDANAGVKLWSFATGGEVNSSPAVANGVVYIGSFDHEVYALNASTGAKLWSFATGGAVESSPAVVNGIAYVGSDDGRLYAFGRPDTYFMIKSSANPSLLYQPVTFTTTSVARDKSLGYVTGTVTFKDGAKTLGTAPISGSHASITTNALGIGTHNIMAYYSGNSLFAPNSASMHEVITEVALSPASIDFGDALVGPPNLGPPQTVTITDVGSTPLSIAKLFVTGNFIIQTTTCGTSLAAGNSCTVTIMFQPLDVGNRYGNLWLYDNGGGNPQKVSLTGYAYMCEGCECSNSC